MSNQKLPIGDYQLVHSNITIEVKEYKGLYAFINGTCVANTKIKSFATVKDLNKLLKKIL